MAGRVGRGEILGRNVNLFATTNICTWFVHSDDQMTSFRNSDRVVFFILMAPLCQFTTATAIVCLSRD